jgi:type I restriction enzyme S subunit
MSNVSSSNSHKGNTPNLRFQGFTDGWELTTIGAVYDERSERGNEEMELLSVTMNEGVKRRSEIEGKDNSSEDKSNYKIVHIGDIVYNSMRMWQGASGISQYYGIVSPAYTVLKPKMPIANEFFAALFKTRKLVQTFQKNSQGLTSDTWNLKYPQIAPIKISVPSLQEQTKIAKMLTLFDLRIKQQERLISFFKSYKRGLSITIFDKKSLIINSTVRTVPLGSFCNITMGQSPDSTSYHTEGIGLPLVQGNADMKNGITAPTKHTSSPTKICDAGNIILSVRAPVGSVGVSNQKICLGRGVCSISSLNNDYILQYLKHCEKQWRTLEQGGTFTAISGDDIKNFPLVLPNNIEIESIVKLLKGLDDLISCQEMLLEKLIHCKQSMLQSLFI